MFDTTDDLGMILGSICVDEFLKVNTLFVVHVGAVGADNVYTKQIVFRLLSNASIRTILFAWYMYK